MDHQEEHNSNHVDETAAPENGVAAESIQNPTDSPEAAQDDSASEKDHSHSPDHAEHSPVNHHSTEGTLPDDSEQLKSLVKVSIVFISISIE